MSSIASLRSALWLGLGLAACSGGKGATSTPASTDPSGSTFTTGFDTADTSTTPTTGFDNQAGVCDNPVALTQDSDAGPVPSGYVRCANGVVHRESAVAAEFVTGATGTCPGATYKGGCATDCTDQPNGFCNAVHVDADYCRCEYACTDDSDCGAGQVCHPNGAQTECITAYCTTDADCGAPMLCQRQTHYDVCSQRYYIQACQSSDDECRADRDCVDQGLGDECHYSRTGGNYICTASTGGDCGRPFTIEGRARMAGTTRRGDWSATVEEQPVDAAVAAWWLRAAQAEHASVASFSRFALELMHLGAPPDLLAEAHMAGLDEIRHAQLCFGMASAHGAGAVGPGALSVEGALSGGLDIVSIARRLVEEACVGETLAALEAAEGARLATEPLARAALSEIAADEQRHATLGWRCLRWVLARCAPSERAEVVSALHAAIARDDQPTGSARGLQAHGILDPEARRELFAAGRRAILVPLAASLTGTAASFDASA